MLDVLKKYTYGGVKVAFVTLEKVFNDTVSAHSLDKECAEITAYAELIAAVVVASFKEEDASVSVNIKKGGDVFGAVAENDGRVCGFYEKEKDEKHSDIVLEITRRLHLRGAYKSVVSAVDITSAVNEYFKTSLQVEARFTLGRNGRIFYALLIEQFPITCEREEIWRHSAEEEAEYLKPIFEGDILNERELFKKYNLVDVVSQKYGCTCSASSVSDILENTPKEELAKAADEDGYIEIRCKFCGKIRKRKIC